MNNGNKRRVNDVIESLENKEDFEQMVCKSNTESEFRNEEVPTPHSEEQLISYIRSLVNKNHDYGTCVYAMSMAAVASFNYIAHKLGVSGFQASCADLNILSRIRNLKCGFRIFNYADLLYPQKDISITSLGMIDENIEGLAKIAKEKLKKYEKAEQPHSEVKKRLEYIINREKELSKKGIKK